MSQHLLERNPDDYWPSHDYINGEEIAEIVPDDVSVLNEQMAETPVMTPAQVVRATHRANRASSAAEGADPQMAVEGSTETQESPEARMDRLEASIANIIDAIETKVVPKSAAEAEQFYGKLLKINDIAQNIAQEAPELYARIDESVRKDLIRVAAKGMDNWRLGQRERAEWANISGLTGPNRLSAAQRALMDGLSPEGGNETDRQKFARLQRHAVDRLRLDDELNYVGRHHFPEQEQKVKHEKIAVPSPTVTLAAEDGRSSRVKHDMPTGTTENYPNEESSIERPGEVDPNEWSKLSREDQRKVADAHQMIDQMRQVEQAKTTDQATVAKEAAENSVDTSDGTSRPDLLRRTRHMVGSLRERMSGLFFAKKPVEVDEAVWQQLSRADKRKVVRVHAELARQAQQPTSEVGRKPKEVTIKKSHLARGIAGLVIASSLFAAAFAPKHSSEEVPKQEVTTTAEAVAGLAGQTADNLRQVGEQAKAAAAAKAKAKAEAEATKAVEDQPQPPEAFVVHKGDRVWDVMEQSGVPESEIMQRIDAAAKASGLNYQWHGSEKHRWIEVNGKSDTKFVINALGKYIKR